MQLNTISIVSLYDKLKEYFPSTSEFVPIDVPATLIVANSTGLFSSSLNLPDILTFSPNKQNGKKKEITKNIGKIKLLINKKTRKPIQYYHL